MGFPRGKHADYERPRSISSKAAIAARLRGIDRCEGLKHARLYYLLTMRSKANGIERRAAAVLRRPQREFSITQSCNAILEELEELKRPPASGPRPSLLAWGACTAVQLADRSFRVLSP